MNYTLQWQWTGDIYMRYSIEMVYFDDESYLHRLYLGYGINAIRKAMPLARVSTRFIDKSTCSIDRVDTFDFIVIFLSLGRYEIFHEFCESLQDGETVIVCHYVPTYLGRDILAENPSVNFAVVGEFDITLKELLSALVRDEDFSTCKGIMYRHNNEVVYTGDRELLADLDCLDYVERDNFRHSSDLFHIFASRGCEGNCPFCDRNALYFNGRCKQRFRSIDNIIGEIDYLHDNYNCKFINFSDSTFCGNHNVCQRLNELYSKLVNRPYFVQFFINMRAEQIDGNSIECLRKLTEVGLGKVFVGIESFNQADLNLYNKISAVSTNEKAVKIISDLNRHGEYDEYWLECEIGFIMFNPYTTIEQLENNVFSLENNHILLDTNIISSRLVCNYVQPLTAQVDRSGLLNVPISHMTLREKTAFDLKYKFQDPVVERIYNTIIECYRLLDIKLPKNVAYVRNRYYKFFGCDKYLINLDDTYSEWAAIMSSFCSRLMHEVISLERKHIPSKHSAMAMCINFKNDFLRVEKKLRTDIARAMARLQRIGEAIYGE